MGKRVKVSKGERDGIDRSTSKLWIYLRDVSCGYCASIDINMS